MAALTVAGVPHMRFRRFTKPAMCFVNTVGRHETPHIAHGHICRCTCEAATPHGMAIVWLLIAKDNRRPRVVTITIEWKPVWKRLITPQALTILTSGSSSSAHATVGLVLLLPNVILQQILPALLLLFLLLLLLLLPLLRSRYFYDNGNNTNYY